MFAKFLLLFFCSQKVIFKIFYLPSLISSFCFQIFTSDLLFLNFFLPNFVLEVCFPNFFSWNFVPDFLFKFHQMAVSKIFPLVIFISYLLYIFSFLQFLSLRFWPNFVYINIEYNFCVYNFLSEEIEKRDTWKIIRVLEKKLKCTWRARVAGN